MPYLPSLFLMPLLQEMLEEKYVRRQSHPTLPLHILNYSEKAQFEKKWNEVTRQCRGLIYNEDLEIVARPFDKFFNYGEWDYIADDYRESHCIVTDKLDGSLGILYPTPEGWSIATRGSFTSDQAIHATEILRERYSDWEPDSDFTYLFEIIYPENRIVCDYQGANDLYLLGMRHIHDGWSAPPSTAYWPGPTTEILSYTTFEDALAAAPRPGKEGMVVHFTKKDERLKLKQEDYVRLHRLVTGLNERRIWESLSGGLSDVDLLTPMPEEFAEWAGKVIIRLKAQYTALYWQVTEAYMKLTAELGVGYARKDFALAANRTPWPKYMFMLYDGRDITQDIWKELKPDFRQGPWSRSEDAQ